MRTVHIFFPLKALRTGSLSLPSASDDSELPASRYLFLFSNKFLFAFITLYVLSLKTHLLSFPESSGWNLSILSEYRVTSPPTLVLNGNVYSLEPSTSTYWVSRGYELSTSIKVPR